VKQNSIPFLLCLSGILICLSVACEKDDTVEDIDGNRYNTITIGTQTWMQENLRTTHLNDGTPLVNITDEGEWYMPKYAGYCNYDNDELNVSKYGRLYHFYSVETGKLAPVGWRVPTKEDWEILINYLMENGYSCDGIVGSDRVAKSLGRRSDWEEYSREECIGNPAYPLYDNKSGFTAVPSGYRYWGFKSKGYIGHLWSSTVYSSDAAYIFKFDYINPVINMGPSLKNTGMAVRCIKE
jgi:uncharacterized protein (TIGR02145 family)